MRSKIGKHYVEKNKSYWMRFPTLSGIDKMYDELYIDENDGCSFISIGIKPWFDINKIMSYIENKEVKVSFDYIDSEEIIMKIPQNGFYSSLNP